jgi:hypothetical protein
MIVEAGDKRRNEASKKHGSCPLGAPPHAAGMPVRIEFVAWLGEPAFPKTNRSVPILVRCSIQRIFVATHNEMEWRPYHGDILPFGDPGLMIG